jgi:hypothetical protein
MLNHTKITRVSRTREKLLSITVISPNFRIAWASLNAEENGINKIFQLIYWQHFEKHTTIDEQQQHSRSALSRRRVTRACCLKAFLQVNVCRIARKKIPRYGS